tara:strand:+ start:296 stop:547 length:252 start_codon:yes stop_codon:yes gene_type:complete
MSKGKIKIKGLWVELNTIIKCLEDVSELIGNGAFNLDNETEDELMETGCIGTYVEDMEHGIDSALEIFKFLNRDGVEIELSKK